jgi:hypothetical protein
VLCRCQVQQKHGRNTAVAEAVSADTVDTVDGVDYRAGRTTGSKRRAVQ